MENMSVRSCGLTGTVDKQIFFKTSNVKTYDFSYNKLDGLDFSDHSGALNVHEIYARNNRLETVKLHPLFQGLKKLDLANNQLADTKFLEPL